MDNRKYIYRAQQMDINRPLPAPLITASDKDELQRRANVDAEKFTPPLDKFESKRQEVEILHQRFNEFVGEIKSDSFYYSTDVLQAKINRQLTRPELETVDVIKLFRDKIVTLKEGALVKMTSASQGFQSQVEQARTQFTNECAARIKARADIDNEIAFLKNTYVYILQEAARQFSQLYGVKS